MINYEAIQIQAAAWRKQLHRIPELGFEVYKTGNYIKNELSNMPCEVMPVIETGITAYFDFGQKETIAFRADMDALPIQEETDLDFSSTHKGCMHACGHDGHMANMLGFAQLLSEHKDKKTNVPFNALLIFQPAEETINGAKSISETNIFEKYHVKNIYGIHLWPTLKKGLVASRPGPMMARSTEINVDFQGVSTHCGEPEKGKDALATACHFVESIYSYKRNQISDPGLIQFGKMNSGNVRNAISAHTRIEGSMRTFYDRTWDQLIKKMNQIGEEIFDTTGVKVTIDSSKGHQSVINNEDLFDAIRPALSKINFQEMDAPVMIAEDFSFFQKRIPGIFFFLGTGSGIPLHSQNYTFDDDVFLPGIKLFEELFLFPCQ